MNKYIISSFTYRCAERTAREMGLPPYEWIYVSLRIKEKREDRLQRIRTTQDKLIGYFSDEEILRITMK